MFFIKMKLYRIFKNLTETLLKLIIDYIRSFAKLQGERFFLLLNFGKKLWYVFYQNEVI
jgi:hypothetical protein